MNRLTKRLGRARTQRGFSLVELMVAGLVLVVGLIMLSQFFASAAARVMESDVRSVLHQVANEEMENIRGLPYTDVGVDGGNPDGSLLASETRTVENTNVLIERSVTYQRDDSYDPSGPYPGNYRRVTVTVSACDGDWERIPSLQAVELVSNIAGGATGGTLLVNVQDSQGAAVEGASFTIVNEPLAVYITTSDMITNELGIMLVPGLKVDASGNYVVAATKDGYSEDSVTDFPVIEGTSQEVVLIIDKVSTMNIKVVDLTGADVVGIPLLVSGPEEYELSTASAAGGVTIDELRFSTSADPYIVTLPAGTYPKQEQSVALPADSTVTVEFVVDTTGITTTTTDPSATTTTVASTTTTSGVSYGSLRVRVQSTELDSHGHNRRIRGASVNLGVWNKSTNSSGNCSFGLGSGWNPPSEYPVVGTTYSFTITAQYHEPYSGTYTITGVNSVTITLDYTGEPG